MKTAVCLSGLPRFWTGFQKEMFPDADYFIHTWGYDRAEDIADTCWAWYEQPNWNGHSIEWVDFNSMEEFFQPKAMTVEYWSKTTKNYFQELTNKFDTRDGQGRKSVIPMWYGVQKCIFSQFLYSKATGTTYDRVIRARFDTRLQKPIDYNIEDGIHIPNEMDFLGINDQFAYGDQGSMLYYSDLVLSINDAIIFRCAENILLNPEILLKSHLSKSSIKIHRFNQEITLQRN